MTNAELADKLDACDFEDVECSIRKLTEIQGLMSLAAEALRRPVTEARENVTIPRELLTDLLAYGLILTVEGVTYGAGRSHRERIQEAQALLSPLVPK